MPFQKDRYPDNWNQISLAIRTRDGWRCKWCGAENGKPHPETGSKVVLTVAHLGVDKPGLPGSGSKHDKMDCRDENLAALCNRCHLLYDLDEHIENAKKTRRRKKIRNLIEVGQQAFWGVLGEREEQSSNYQTESACDVDKAHPQLGKVGHKAFSGLLVSLPENAKS